MEPGPHEPFIYLFSFFIFLASCIRKEERNCLTSRVRVCVAKGKSVPNTHSNIFSVLGLCLL